MRELTALVAAFLLTASITWPQTKIGGTTKRGGTGKMAVSTGGPPDFVTDSFTESGADVDAASHTGELGATWTNHPHANYTGTAEVESDTDRLFSTNTSAYYASGTPPS